jgi:hypothetical protein
LICRGKQLEYIKYKRNSRTYEHTNICAADPVDTQRMHATAQRGRERQRDRERERERERPCTSRRPFVYTHTHTHTHTCTHTGILSEQFFADNDDEKLQFQRTIREDMTIPCVVMDVKYEEFSVGMQGLGFGVVIDGCQELGVLCCMQISM